MAKASLAEQYEHRQFLAREAAIERWVDTGREAARKSMRRAIAKPLRELRTEESIMRAQGDQIRADVIRRAIRAIEAATKAPRKGAK